jgi:hypothetical protein
MDELPAQKLPATGISVVLPRIANLMSSKQAHVLNTEGIWKYFRSTRWYPKYSGLVPPFIQ